MKKVVFILLGILLLAACSPSPIESSKQSGLKVAATIFPLTDIVKNIGGDKVDVQNILPAGASPHTFELTPWQVKSLQGVRLIFSIGYGLDSWVLAVSDSLPDVKIVEASKGIDFIKGGETDEPVNPHYWLSIENGKLIAAQAADYLSQLDPPNSAYYQSNAQTYIAQLDSAEKGIKKQLADLSSRDIIIFHDAWPYFAREYNLNVLASFEPFPGKEPTPQYLKNISQQIKEYKVKALFAEPQLSLDVLQPFASDMGLKIYVIDPEGGGIPGIKSYIQLMQYDADIIYQALK